MASAKKRHEERTDVVDWTDANSDEHNFAAHDDDDDDVDDDVMYDDVSMPRDAADSMYDVIDRARPRPPPRTSGQMLRSYVTDVYGPMALVQ